MYFVLVKSNSSEGSDCISMVLKLSLTLEHGWNLMRMSCKKKLAESLTRFGSQAKSQLDPVQRQAPDTYTD